MSSKPEPKKPSDIRDEIIKLRSQIQLNMFQLKTEQERASREHLNTEIKKQAVIIRAAKAKIESLMKQHRLAPDNILAIERQIQHCRRKLAAAENHALIRKLETVTQELNSLLKEST